MMVSKIKKWRRGGGDQQTSAKTETKSFRRALLIRLGAAAVVLFLLEQPGIISSLCQCLTCTQLDYYSSDYYIKSRNNIQCYTDRYNWFILTVVLPALLFWTLVVPLAIFLALYTKRKQLFNSETLRVVLGNFYNPYAKNTYYWGVVIMVFKMTIFILDAVLPTSSMAKRYGFHDGVPRVLHAVQEAYAI